MKKFLLIFFLVTLTPNLGFAIQGTCSWHSGVNCSAGADWDGSTICNDGWRDSSESYFDVAICKNENKRHFCTTNEWNSIYSKTDLPELEKKMSEINSQISLINREAEQVKLNSEISARNNGSIVSFLAGESAEIERNRAVKVLNLASQYDLFNATWKNSNRKAENECYDLGDKRYYETMTNMYNKLGQTSNNVEQNKTSACRPGYVFSNGSCIDNSLNCMNQYGKNSYYNNGACQCGAGYKMNYNKTQCVLSSESGCQINASLVEGKCACNADSFSDGTNCIKLLTYCQLTYNTTVTSDGLSCFCPNNGVFNKQDRSCGTKLFPALQNSTSTKAQINNYFSRSLRKGMSGDDVKQLQIMLQKLNYLPSIHVPSVYFGSVTNLALVKFQKDNKIQPATGTFGPSTQAKLISLTK